MRNKNSCLQYVYMNKYEDDCADVWESVINSRNWDTLKSLLISNFIYHN